MSVPKWRDVYQLILATPQSSSISLDIVTVILKGWGVSLTQTVEYQRGKRKYLKIYLKTRKNALLLKRRIEGYSFKNVSVNIKRVLQKDWVAQGRGEISPFKLTQNVVVVPLGLKNKYKVKKSHHPIYLDIGLTFGTGLHETTRFMSQLIESRQGKFDSFLDIGVGTGILSLVASMSGARKIKAIDLDIDAVRSARRNFKENNLKKATVNVQNINGFKFAEKYDFVAANLYTEELIKNYRNILTLVKKGKYLAVSGVSHELLEKYQRKFHSGRLKCLRKKSGKDWNAFLYKKL